jgi:hypothetical protein
MAEAEKAPPAPVAAPAAAPLKKPNKFAKGATIASLPPRRKSSKLLSAASLKASRTKKVWCFRPLFEVQLSP